MYTPLDTIHKMHILPLGVGFADLANNTKLNYTYSLSVGPNVLNTIISDNIGNERFKLGNAIA